MIFCIVYIYDPLLCYAAMSNIDLFSFKVPLRRKISQFKLYINFLLALFTWTSTPVSAAIKLRFCIHTSIQQKIYILILFLRGPSVRKIVSVGIFFLFTCQSDGIKVWTFLNFICKWNSSFFITVQYRCVTLVQLYV